MNYSNLFFGLVDCRICRETALHELAVCAAAAPKPPSRRRLLPMQLLQSGRIRKCRPSNVPPSQIRTLFHPN